MKEQAQSDREREHTTLGHENAIRQQEALRRLNDQLQAQIVAFQNNQPSTLSESKPEVGGSAEIRILDELIQKRITKANPQSHQTLSATKVSDSPF